MLLIPCPCCGPRNEDEFVYGGDASREAPADPWALSDAEWAQYLYLRDNPCGLHREFWYHRHGCGSWLVVERDTLTHRIDSARPARPRETAVPA